MATHPDSEWIEWTGGECPISPETSVYWAVRCDDPEHWDERFSAPAGDLFWGRKHEREHAMDIIAYRVVSA